MFTARECARLLCPGCGKAQNLLGDGNKHVSVGASLMSLQTHSRHTRRVEQPASGSTPDAQMRAEIKQGSDQVMIGFRKTVAAATIAGSMLVGGVVGAALYGVSAISAAAATNAASPSATTPGATTPFVSNEAAAHEATESAAREAQENAGIRPTVP